MDGGTLELCFSLSLSLPATKLFSRIHMTTPFTLLRLTTFKVRTSVTYQCQCLSNSFLTSHTAANAHLNLCSTCTKVFWRPGESWYDEKIRHDDAYSDTDIAHVVETSMANYLKSAQDHCRICKTSRDSAPADWIE